MFVIEEASKKFGVDVLPYCQRIIDEKIIEVISNPVSVELISEGELKMNWKKGVTTTDFHLFFQT